MTVCEAATVQPRTLLSIQYLRGLAALTVVLHHVGWVAFPQGAAGVDVFFVISGFIMVHVAGRARSPAAFLWARALRVLPLYWLLTALAAAWRPGDGTGRVLASLLLWPTLRADGEWAPILVQGWTLTYEAFFYAAFALALLVPAHRRLLALTGGLGMCVLVANPPLFVTPGFSPVMLVEFLGGAWLAQAWRAQRVLPPRVAWGALVSGVALIAMQPGGTVLPWRVMAWGGPSVLVLAGALGIEAASRLPRLPALRLLGDASYALYLTHVMVMWAAKPLLAQFPLPVALPALVAACIGVGIAVHLWVEVPMMALLRGWARRVRPVTPHAERARP